jgi:hypothetical protein
MDPEAKNLSAEESLAIITSMISDAQGKVQRNSFFFLFWGWIVAVANIGFYILIQAGVNHPYLIWVITIPAWIFTIVRMLQRRRERQAKSHFDSISMWLWMSFGVIIFTLVVFGSKINYQLNPVILIIASIPTFVSGIIVRFKPLIVGGIAFWIFGVIAFLVPFQTQPLIGGLAIICGYLIPGYMLKYKSE